MRYSSSELFKFAEALFPLNRSITGNGVRQSLALIKDHLPGLNVIEVPTGTECFDWIIPQEWNVKTAYILDPDNNRIADFDVNNLHLLNYSTAKDAVMPLSELDKHLYSLPERPNAIPYVTSYYEERWGFCISDAVRKNLKDGLYTVKVDSDHTNGALSIGELVIRGETEEEVFVSTYTCHPSMANNETSGMVVTAFLAKWVSELPKRRFTYRFVFAPETIGPAAYMSQDNMLNHLKTKVRAAFNVTCVGDDRVFSFLPSKSGKTYTDRVARHVLKHYAPDYIEYSFAKSRGSDECQYASPMVNLPIVSIMRSKYVEYPEYHTSDDNLSLINGSGLKGAFDMIIKCLQVIEKNQGLHTNIIGEPRFSKHNLRPTLGGINLDISVIMRNANLMMYADGDHDLIDVAELMDVPVDSLFEYYDNLVECGLITLR